MILGLFKISGHSMLPSLKPNDTVIISSLLYFFTKPRIGDIVIFKKENKIIIKRITKKTQGKFHVEGDNKNDSLAIGLIEKDDIIGKVIWKV